MPDNTLHASSNHPLPPTVKKGKPEINSLPMLCAAALPNWGLINERAVNQTGMTRATHVTYTRLPMMFGDTCDGFMGHVLARLTTDKLDRFVMCVCVHIASRRVNTWNTPPPPTPTHRHVNVAG